MSDESPKLGSLGEVETVSIMPSVRGMVRIWRIHFESGINSQAVEDDIVRILSQLLRSPDTSGDEVWPDTEVMLQRWHEQVAGPVMRELEQELARLSNLIEEGSIVDARVRLDRARRLVSDWILAT